MRLGRPEGRLVKVRAAKVEEKEEDWAAAREGTVAQRKEEGRGQEGPAAQGVRLKSGPEGARVP